MNALPGTWPPSSGLRRRAYNQEDWNKVVQNSMTRIMEISRKVRQCVQLDGHVEHNLDLETLSLLWALQRKFISWEIEPPRVGYIDNVPRVQTVADLKPLVWPTVTVAKSDSTPASHGLFHKRGRHFASGVETDEWGFAVPAVRMGVEPRKRRAARNISPDSRTPSDAQFEKRISASLNLMEYKSYVARPRVSSVVVPEDVITNLGSPARGWDTPVEEVPRGLPVVTETLGLPETFNVLKGAEKKTAQVLPLTPNLRGPLSDEEIGELFEGI
jgi:hypothetical protein